MSIIQHSNITHTAAENHTSLGYFASSGFLDNSEPENMLITNASDMAYAISRDLGTIQATPAPIVWAIGYATDPAISYANESASSTQWRRPYYKSQYSDDQLLVTLFIFWRCFCSNILVQIIDFLNDFSSASERAQQLDQKVLKDAASVSSLLGDLVSLAVPQVYGSSQLTIGTDESGELDTSDVMMFIKDIGGSSPK